MAIYVKKFGVKKERSARELIPSQGLAHQLLLDLCDRLGRQRIHQIPKVLAVHAAQATPKQILAAGGFRPIPPTPLAGGHAHAADRPQNERDARGQMVADRLRGHVGAAGVDVAIDAGGDIECVRHLEQCRDRPVGIGLEAEALGESREAFEKMLGLAEIGEHNGPGFAVHAARFHDVPIFVAA